MYVHLLGVFNFGQRVHNLISYYYTLPQWVTISCVLLRFWYEYNVIMTLSLSFASEDGCRGWCMARVTSTWRSSAPISSNVSIAGLRPPCTYVTMTLYQTNSSQQYICFNCKKPRWVGGVILQDSGWFRVSICWGFSLCCHSYYGSNTDNGGWNPSKYG